MGLKYSFAKCLGGVIGIIIVLARVRSDRAQSKDHQRGAKPLCCWKPNLAIAVRDDFFVSWINLQLRAETAAPTPGPNSDEYFQSMPTPAPKVLVRPTPIPPTVTNWITEAVTLIGIPVVLFLYFYSRVTMNTCTGEFHRSRETRIPKSCRCNCWSRFERNHYSFSKGRFKAFERRQSWCTEARKCNNHV